MIKSIEELKEKRPDLARAFESLNKKELLRQCYSEAMDAINMQERVQLFMNECTRMSKTNYTVEVIKRLIDEKKQDEIDNFCFTLLEDEILGADIMETIKEKAENSTFHK